MKLGIMQPYFLPYIGYFQLINLVDNFVIYDDVQYIKGGWINRNRILVNGKPSLFTLRIKNDDYRLYINERFLVNNRDYENKKIIKSIALAYGRAPYFGQVMPVLEDILSFDEKNLAKFIRNSLKVLCDYMSINTKFITSSQIEKNESIRGQERVIEINKILKSSKYINAIGGTELYSKEEFKSNGIELNFIKTREIEYKQFNNDFVNNLSIIDVLMFNSKEEINELLNQYDLV